MADDDLAARRLRDAVVRLREQVRGRALTGRSHEDADEAAGDRIGMRRAGGRVKDLRRASELGQLQEGRHDTASRSGLR